MFILFVESEALCDQNLICLWGNRNMGIHNVTFANEIVIELILTLIDVNKQLIQTDVAE